MKKILYITHADSVHDQRFMQTMLEAGYEVYALRALAGDWPSPAGVKDLPALKFEFPLDADKASKYSRKLRQVINELQPDLVQAGPLHELTYLAALAGAKPLLAQSWGFDLMNDSFATPQNLNRTNLGLSYANGLIVDNHASAEKAEGLGFNKKNIFDFPWGVDLALFNREKNLPEGLELRQQLGWEENKVYFCLRAWEPKYGVTDLLQAFAEAQELIPRLRLILANGGSQEALVKKLIRKFKLKDKVHLAGRVPNAELPKYYAAADVYVSPSHVDGSSVSLMEALASSLPALVSDIPANLEWVQEGLNGWVYSDGNIEDLTDGLLTASQARLEPMRLAARRVAELKADWQKNKEVLLNAWQSLAKKER